MNKISFTILVLLFLFSACRNRPVNYQAVEYNNVRIVPVARSSVATTVHVAGIIMPEEEIKLSFKTGGIVGEIYEKEGARVKKGDLLASLNLSEVNSHFELAENSYRKALRDYERVKRLYADTVATLEQFQNTTTALDMARSNLEIARFNLERSRITAPADGIILKQLARENELVSSGYPVFLFGVTGGSWKLTAGVADRDIVKIHAGDSAVVMPDAWPGVSLPGIVERTGELASPVTGTFEVQIRFSDGGYRLAAGFIATAGIFPPALPGIVTVPAGSLVEIDGDSGYVFTVTDSSTVRKIRVNIRETRGPVFTLVNFPEEIINVVSEGAAYLRDGMKVNVLK